MRAHTHHIRTRKHIRIHMHNSIHTHTIIHKYAQICTHALGWHLYAPVGFIGFSVGDHKSCRFQISSGLLRFVRVRVPESVFPFTRSRVLKSFRVPGWCVCVLRMSGLRLRVSDAQRLYPASRRLNPQDRATGRDSSSIPVRIVFCAFHTVLLPPTYTHLTFCAVRVIVH